MEVAEIEHQVFGPRPWTDWSGLTRAGCRRCIPSFRESGMLEAIECSDPDTWVAVTDRGEIGGWAICVANYSECLWEVQLVVHEDLRRERIGHFLICAIREHVVGRIAILALDEYYAPIPGEYS